ncbi:cytochrome P450 [Podospora didyma]|uniref:Cytochrome P450 n=1 Tax=Podospora didyma TaxID=330526 RepID=A0AAE0U268_9PEZI|nr:cytochrome P450 [Podospora didyma]
MSAKLFYLLGEPVSTAKEIEVASSLSEDDLKHLVASHFAIVVPDGISFLSEQRNTQLPSLSEILETDEPIAISIDGKRVRDPPGPKGLPYVGNFFEIYPDHLGNHQRLFDTYGAVIKTVSMGRTIYLTNDPAIAAMAFTEGDFFSKRIIEGHPLFPIKNEQAGVFLGDTDTEEWRIVHKFLPPAFGPKAVRHYAPTMQLTVEDAFKVFDELDGRGEAWNVYPYMLKLGSQAVGKLVLGIDFQQFTSVDAKPHELVILIAEVLSLNKKVTSWGSWYGSLPFGDPKALRDKRDRIMELIEESVKAAKQGGIEDLDLQEAAIKATNMVDYCLRATDSKGNKLPKKNLVDPLLVATGAGFTTTSSLLSWLIYSLVTYPGMQDRLLQELVDNGFGDDTQITAEFTNKLTFLDHFIKETQRRHNPSYQPGRTAQQDLILPGGYKIPQDGILIPAIHHIHNNPALWDNPARFDPDRWDTEAVKNRHRAAYIPFAMGPRGCIGFNFALQEVKVFLPKLVYRYRFEREGVEDTVEYDPMFQLIRPNNLYVRAERRVKWPPRTGL